MHEIVIIVAKYFIVISLFLAFIVWLKLATPDKKEFIVLALLGGIITLALAKIGSHLFYNTRPFVVGNFTPYFTHGNDNGFPSDHTLFTSFLAFLSFHYNKKIGSAMFVIAAMVGLSRVIAGVHHLVDIVGAMVFGALGFYISLWIVKTLTKKSKKQPQAASGQEQ